MAFYLAAMLFGTPVAETILASVHVRARPKAGHMEASDLIKALQTPCDEGAVHIWVLCARRSGRSAATGPPAAMFYYSRDRKGEHPAAPSGRIRPGCSRPMPLTAIARSTCPSDMPVRSWRSGAGRHAKASCSSPWPTLPENARRRAAGRSAVALSPIAIEVVRRIDTLFEVERSIRRQERRRAQDGPPGAEQAALSKSLRCKGRELI